MENEMTYSISITIDRILRKTDELSIQLPFYNNSIYTVQHNNEFDIKLSTLNGIQLEACGNWQGSKVFWTAVEIHGDCVQRSCSRTSDH
jgi:hypothetical protein